MMKMSNSPRSSTNISVNLSEISFFGTSFFHNFASNFIAPSSNTDSPSLPRCVPLAAIRKGWPDISVSTAAIRPSKPSAPVASSLSNVRFSISSGLSFSFDISSIGQVYAVRLCFIEHILQVLKIPLHFGIGLLSSDHVSNTSWFFLD